MRCGREVISAREGSCAQAALEDHSGGPRCPSWPRRAQTGGSPRASPQAALGPAAHEHSPRVTSGGLITDSCSDRASMWVQRGAQPPPPAHSALNYSSVPLKHRKSSGFLENFDVTEHFERCFVRQCFDREVHIRPLSQSPARTAARGRTHGGPASACTLPGQEAHPHPGALYHPPTSSQGPPRPCQEQGAPLREASFICSCPGGLGQGRGCRGAEAGLALLPFLPALFLGHPEAQFLGMLTGRWVTNLTQLLAGNCGLRSPPSWKPKPQREGRGGEDRVGRGVESRGEQTDLHGALQSSQGGQMPDAGHQPLCSGKRQAGQDAAGVGCAVLLGLQNCGSSP